ncbi:choice-of-anchor D domain-containing protein [Labilithrix luteola]|nr:choice-of-anchor D domain-containing protein [Labilithrix luteola]
MRVRTAALLLSMLTACVGDDPPPAPGVVNGGNDAGVDSSTNPGGGNATLTIDPLNVTFPVTAPGDTSEERDLVVTNKGTAAAPALEKATVTGANASSFQIASDGCVGKALAAGESCTARLAFKPAAEGAATATLTIGTLSAQLAGDSSVFTPETTSDGVANSLRAVHVKDSTHVYAVGDSGRVIVSNGNGWTAQAAPAGSNELRSVYASSGGYVYVGGAGPTLIVQKPSSTGFDTVAVPAGGPSAINALWATPAGAQQKNVFALGEGGKWLSLDEGAAPNLPQSYPVGTAVFGASGNHNAAGGGSIGLCAAGANATLAYYSSSNGGFGGSATTLTPASRTFTGVWTDGPNVVVVASDGSISRGTGCGSGLAVEYTGTPALAGIWGTSTKDLWAVGSGGTILHSSAPGAWTAVASGTTKDLRAIHGSSGSNLYAVGDGIILHKKK